MIEQVRFSKSVRFFEKGFCDRWGVSAYQDKDSSCLFVGVFTASDVAAINAHKGLRIIWHPGRIRKAFYSVNKDNAVVMVESGKPLPPVGFKYKHVNLEVKDFSMFSPTPLGESVYIYLGNERSMSIYGSGFIEQLKKAGLKHNVITGMQGHSIDYVHDTYYNNSFINIKPHITGGTTTATEMALMGRRTLSNMDNPFCESYANIEQALEIINKESKKIGTMQESQVPNTFFTGSEWKQESWWI